MNMAEIRESNEAVDTPTGVEESTGEHEEGTQGNIARQLSRTVSAQSIRKARDVVIIISVGTIQAVQMFPYGAGIIGAQSIATSLYYGHEYSSQVIAPQDSKTIESHAAWIAASYNLSAGTFVLMGGRLGEVYGHKKMLMAGAVWWLIWHLASGFAPDVISLCIFRGLAGVGGGFLVPNCIAMLGITFPPGPKRNFSMGLFGAMAPSGAAGGCLVAALLIQLTEWKWVFFYAVIFGAVVFTTASISLPWDKPADPNGYIDWVGAYFGVAGLILFNFAWNQAPSVGWQTPYVYALLIVSVVHFAAFIFWEARVAKSPILPFDIWTSKSFGLLLVLASCSFMSIGIFIWYSTLFWLNIRHYSLIEAGANWQPLTILGTAANFLSAWLIPRLQAQYIIAIGNLALVACNTLLATAPPTLTYWAMMFPAVLLVSFTVDFIFAASQIIASGQVDKRRQGVAGSLIGTLLTYGLSTGLGFAGTIEVYTDNGGQDVLRGYRNAVYLAIGFAGLGFVGSILFLRVPKTTKEGWDDEDHDGPENEEKR